MLVKSIADFFFACDIFIILQKEGYDRSSATKNFLVLSDNKLSRQIFNVLCPVCI